MGYTTLSDLYYKDTAAYEEQYQARYNSEYTVHLDFDVEIGRAHV